VSETQNKMDISVYWKS